MNLELSITMYMHFYKLNAEPTWGNFLHTHSCFRSECSIIIEMEGIDIRGREIF